MHALSRIRRQLKLLIECLHTQMESLVVGTEDGKARLYDHSTREFTGLITESPLGLSVRCVKFSPNGHRVAVASE